MHPNVQSSTIYYSQDMATTLMSTSRWMDKEDVVHIYSGIPLSHKKGKILPLAATWVDLEDMMLSEVSRSEKDKYCMIYVESKKYNKLVNIA